MYSIVDVQGYGNFTPKELAIMVNNKTAHFVFKPACKFNQLSSDLKKNVRWLEAHHHTIKWNTGFTDLKEIPNILHMTIVGKIVCKGSQKEMFLRKHGYENILNLDNDSESPNLNDEQAACPFHYISKSVCALRNISIINSYYNFNNKNTPATVL